jgi:hypothetical protein
MRSAEGSNEHRTRRSGIEVDYLRATYTLFLCSFPLVCSDVTEARYVVAMEPLNTTSPIHYTSSLYDLFPGFALAPRKEPEETTAATPPDVKKTPAVIFQCPVCKRTFTRRSSCKRHSHTHTGVRNHICLEPGCNKRFALKSTLKRHMYIHTGERPHKCRVPGCRSAFADRITLKRHRNVHSKTKK